MSYQLCPNIISTILNEIPINKCYHNPQLIETSQTSQYLPLLAGFFYVLLIILLIYTNILNNIIVLIFRLLKFMCTIIFSLSHLPTLHFSNIFHPFEHLLLSILLPNLLYLLYILLSILFHILFTLLSILFHFLYLLNCIIQILIFSYSLLYKINYLVNIILLLISHYLN